MHRIDSNGASSEGLFLAGNPAASEPATEVTPDWLNDIQESLCRLVERAGIPLSKGDYDQLWRAFEYYGVAAGLVGYETVAAMGADLSKQDQVLAVAADDPSGTIYRKSGAPGEGEWVATDIQLRGLQGEPGEQGDQGPVGPEPTAVPTLADLNADLTPGDGTVRYVTNDPIAGNNGTWHKAGASGTGSWVQSSYDRVAAIEERTGINESDTARLLAYTVTTQDHNVTTDTTGVSISPETTRFNAIATNVRSYLRKITLNVGSAGTFNFFRMSKNESGTYNVEDLFLTVELGAGQQTLRADSFEAALFEAGEYLAIHSADGAVEYSSGGVSYSYLGKAAGDDLTFSVSPSTISMSALFDRLATDDIADKLTAEIPVTSSFGNSPVSGAAAYGGSTRVCDSGATAAGALVVAVDLYIQTVGNGTARLLFFDPTGTQHQYNVVHSEPLAGLTAGLNTVLIRDLVETTAGMLVGFYADVDGARIAYTAGGGDYTLSGEASGVVTLGVGAYEFSLRAAYLLPGSTKYAAEYARRHAEKNDASIAAVQQNSPNNYGYLCKDGVVFNEDFSGLVLPSGWESAGAWDFSGGAAKSPAAGDWDTYVSTGSNSALDRNIIHAHVQVDDAASIFALVTRDLSIAGTVAEVDCAAGCLNIYSAWEGGPPGSVAATQPIGFAIVVGRKYLISLKKDIAEGSPGVWQAYAELTCTDTVTHETATVRAYYPGTGCGWGKPGVIFRAGDISVLRLIHASLMPRAPRVAIYGDSITEGNSIPTRKDARWAQLAFDALDGDVLISGRGGAKTSDLLARLAADFYPFYPKITILAIGTNDSDITTYSTNLLTLIAQVEAKGSVPILVTLPPRADRQAFITAANAWVKASGYRYVNFASALTLNNDEVTWHPDFDNGDGVHPNVAGHAKMFMQLQLDAPDLLL